eukprot:4377200-Pleurochrysis_carterae.AAC.1
MHSQTRARGEAGLPSPLIGSSTSSPVPNSSGVVDADEDGRIRKQPRVTPSSPPEPGLEEAGTSTYPPLVSPDLPDAEGSESSSHDPWRHA